MFGHAAAGFVLVALADGLVDAAMERQRVLRFHNLGRHGDQFVERLVDYGKHQAGPPVAGGMENGLMKKQVVGDKLGMVVLRRFHRTEFFVNLGDVFFGGPQRRARGQFWFDQ